MLVYQRVHHLHTHTASFKSKTLTFFGVSQSCSRKKLSGYVLNLCQSLSHRHCLSLLLKCHRPFPRTVADLSPVSCWTSCESNIKSASPSGPLLTAPKPSRIPDTNWGERWAGAWKGLGTGGGQSSLKVMDLLPFWWWFYESCVYLVETSYNLQSINLIYLNHLESIS